MFDLPGPLGTLANFLVIALGFGSIIFVHELGHFVAAKWAGIRVLAFSIGFGQIMGSYRKGIGFRRGSSEPEYLQLLKDAKGEAGEKRERARTLLTGTVSPTEYRLSMLPLGGYVKMLGQEDLNPGAVSQEPDSYQNCPASKRMVVISAGVIMNVIMAAILFIIVFTAGLRVFPSQVGFVPASSPAANAISISHPDIQSGLVRGDRIVSINGNTMHSFEAILPEIAMGSQSKPASIMVERDGINSLIEFQATPIKSELSGLLDIGITPAVSTKLKDTTDPQTIRLWKMFSHEYGFQGLEPGDHFQVANNQTISSPFDLLDIAKASNGQPFQAVIDRKGESVEYQLTPVAEMQRDLVQRESELQSIRHILGLTGVMMVNPNAPLEDTKQGLMPGDIFAKIGTTEFPSVAAGIEIIHNNAGQSLDIVVLRENERVKLSVEVTSKGTIGFYQSQTTTHSNLVSQPPRVSRVREADGVGEDSQSNKEDGTATQMVTEFVSLPASTLIEYPGSRITAVGDSPISTLRDVRGALVQATNDDYFAGNISFNIPVTIELPLPVQPDGSIPSTTIDWTLTRVEIETVRELGWTLPGSLAMIDMFEYAQIIDKADSPVNAITRGVSESRRVMLQTYITFLRLFEGSVQVKHLKGPVGIAHIGTQIASQGWVWVLFFMALISINLAVINFLPLPIVDGGQFLMLVYEWIRGKPVPIIIQNVATMAGLLMIGSIFLYVTFNDVKAIFGV
jgi:regulator of sigma E protease